MTKTIGIRPLLRIMKIATLFLFWGISMCYANHTYSQTTQLSLSLKNKSVKDVFTEIEKISEYVFLYHDENLNVKRKVTINANNQTIDKILDDLFEGTDNTYYISDRQVFVSKAKSNKAAVLENVREEQQSPAQKFMVKGVVFDTEKEALIGVTVKLKSKNIVVAVTNAKGEFAVDAGNAGETLVFTYIGMKNKELKLQAGKSDYKIIMENDDSELGSVVVMGIVNRDKPGFTGSYNSIGGDELRAVGSINVLQSIKSLDPSFVVAENNLRGSDPNTMASISIRRGSTMNISSTFDDTSTNPNEPLFILDGFETTLQIVNDLDINRIESITILKDAGSTAIYGSRGGNGVVVIETVKPKPGEVRVGYGGDFQVAAADLSVYNLMNAQEKLEFELKAGRYGSISDWTNEDRIKDYNSRLENVQRGVDTYWLKVPIRVGLTQSHSLNVDGGNSDGFLYQIGGNYKNVEGVMKGSARQTFGGNIKLQYRREKFNIQNSLSVSTTNGYDGAWGSFSEFAKANPYYRMTNADGTIPDFLDTYHPANSKATTAPNPYYNAMLASHHDTKNFSLVNNTNVDWYIRTNLRWSASLSLSSSNGNNISFKDPGHTDYKDAVYTSQGQYSSGNSSSWSYKANTSLNFSHSLQDVHNLTFIGRAEVKSNSANGDSYIATGFPKGIEGIPSYSYSYKENSRPSYSETINREANFLLAFNYNYLYRYLFDLNYNADGSTAFGRNKKFQSFWSVGLGWNINRESFAKDWTGVKNLKVRGTYGKNGNQNVENLSMNVYSYYPGNDIFGASSYLSGLANPNLLWQVVTKASAGIDGTILNDRLNLTFDVFNTDTDPLVVSIDQKPSSGASKYPINLGYLTTKGLEFIASYHIIRDLERRILLNVRLSGLTSKSTYGGFAKALDNLNSAYKREEGVTPNLNVNSMVQFRDGGSPGDLWAVRSLGIDPATGKEVFLTKNGVPTFTYSADDRVVIANQTPDLKGNFVISFRFGKLSSNFSFGYSMGGYDFNSALFSKVENISSGNIVYNQDKRALYDRWQNSGDLSEFKGISLTTQTPISSRFIQRNNYLSGESAKITWDFSKDKWLQDVKLKDLQVSLSYSDLFYLSTMKRERGIDYPFQRSVTIGLRAQF